MRDKKKPKSLLEKVVMEKKEPPLLTVAELAKESVTIIKEILSSPPNHKLGLYITLNDWIEFRKDAEHKPLRLAIRSKEELIINPFVVLRLFVKVPSISGWLERESLKIYNWDRRKAQDIMHEVAMAYGSGSRVYKKSELEEAMLNEDDEQIIKKICMVLVGTAKPPSSEYKGVLWSYFSHAYAEEKKHSGIYISPDDLRFELKNHFEAGSNADSKVNLNTDSQANSEGNLNAELDFNSDVRLESDFDNNSDVDSEPVSSSRAKINGIEDIADPSPNSLANDILDNEDYMLRLLAIKAVALVDGFGKHSSKALEVYRLHHETLLTPSEISKKTETTISFVYDVEKDEYIYKCLKPYEEQLPAVKALYRASRWRERHDD